MLPPANIEIKVYDMVFLTVQAMQQCGEVLILIFWVEIRIW
jgi:hypothetical protein